MEGIAAGICRIPLPLRSNPILSYTGASQMVWLPAFADTRPDAPIFGRTRNNTASEYCFANGPAPTRSCPIPISRCGLGQFDPDPRGQLYELSQFCQIALRSVLVVMPGCPPGTWRRFGNYHTSTMDFGTEDVVFEAKVLGPTFSGSVLTTSLLLDHRLVWREILSFDRGPTPD